MLKRRSLFPFVFIVTLIVARIPSVLASHPFPETSMRCLDLNGRVHTVAESPGCKAVAIVFLSTECPIARGYLPELERLRAEFQSKGIEWFGIISEPSASRREAKAFADEFRIQFPVIFDGSSQWLDLLQPTHVPEVFVIDADRTMVYRGRIDDRYPEVGRPRLEAQVHDLRDALDAVLTSREVSNSRTRPIGCPIEKSSLKERETPVNYHRDIAPIVRANCAECHREGEVAPFPLLSYEDCSKRSGWLSEATSRRTMPPWSAKAGHGHFLDERMLSDYEKNLFQSWHDAGAPEGHPDDAIAPPMFPSGWRLGEPDLVLEAPTDTVIEPSGLDVFQHYVLPVNLPEDKVLVGFEFRPSNPAIAHHAVVFYDMLGAARKKDELTPEIGYRTSGSAGVPVGGVVGLWAPGMTPRFMPEDIGMPIPRGAELLLQIHYHPTGKRESDRSRIGLYFADKPISRPMSKVPLVLGTFMIDVPAGAENHIIRSSVELPAPITVTSVLPHMHFVGKEMKVIATLPTGEKQSLVWIDRWNFYWQDNYVYRKPVSLPAGTRVDIEGVFDNSLGNPLNPSRPPKRVFFGNDTDEEMFLAVFQTIPDGSDSEKAIEQALLASFRRDWASPMVKPDARIRIMAEAVEFLGGKDVIWNLIRVDNRPSMLQTASEGGGH